MDEQGIGRRRWAIPEGYIPSLSHEALCVLNVGEHEAHFEVTIFLTDRDPVGPYRMSIPARRICHFLINELHDPSQYAVCEPDRVGCADGPPRCLDLLATGGECPHDDNRLSRWLSRFSGT